MMKFIASDVDAATSKAKRALGDKAVVISVRNLPSGDVEVSASDRPEPAAPPVTNNLSPESNLDFGGDIRRSLNHQGIKDRETNGGGARLSENVEKKFSEDALNRLRGKLAGSGPTENGAIGSSIPASDRVTAGLTELLEPHGIRNELLQGLISAAMASPIDDDYYRLQTAFEGVFDFAPIDLHATTPIMLIGPTGAGKTSCCAKLAASAIQSTGSAFIMTADVGRAGAIEQIKTYGESLGADYYIVETPSDVDSILNAKRPSGFVLLDTPGVSPYDRGDIVALKSFAEAAGAEPILVLPASGDADEYQDWAAAFMEFGVRRMALTKFDATRRVGAGLVAAYSGKMALAHFSETAFISEGLLNANPEFLARRYLAGGPGRIY